MAHFHLNAGLEITCTIANQYFNPLSQKSICGRQAIYILYLTMSVADITDCAYQPAFAPPVPFVCATSPTVIITININLTCTFPQWQHPDH